jgi:1-acyl-sn-glycerol-3-phosphate acyltransferase
VPFLRRIAAGIGTVDGTPANVDALLSANELVFVLPGGLREAIKPSTLRYRLLWGHRYGFVRAAIRNQAPIVPVASMGADDIFDLVGDAYGRGRRWLHTTRIPIPLPSRLLPIPHLTRLRFIVGEPIEPSVSADQAENPVAVKRFRREVEGALHELIERELAAREGIEVDE